MPYLANGYLCAEPPSTQNSYMNIAAAGPGE